MNEHDALSDVAAAIDDVAIQLAALSERLYARMDELQGGPETAMDPMDQARWAHRPGPST